MSKITVEQFKLAGFSAVAGDNFGGDTISKIDAKAINASNSNVTGLGYPIVSLVPRPNTGTQPVGDDCVVEVTYDNGMRMRNSAGLLKWCSSNVTSIASWSPYLPSILDCLESQMDKPVFKTNLTREEFNAIENVEWVNGDVACYYNKQLREGGNLIYVSQHPTHSDHSVVFASEEVVQFFTVPTAMLSKPLTPEQVAINDIYDILMDSEIGVMEMAKAVYDAGYRK